MKTPFDDVIEFIEARRYHNHRRDDHSDIVSEGVFRDLLEKCPPLHQDYEAGRIGKWLNVRTPGARARKIDMLVGEPLEGGNAPNLDRLRLSLENKSVTTAHRNAYSRYDDLDEVLKVLHTASPEAIKVATVLVGVARRVLNVPDRVKPLFRNRERGFEERIKPRLSSGDESLFTEFPGAISENRATDAQNTVEKFRQLPRRPPGQTHVIGYDFILLVPVFIDNVHNPSVVRQNNLGIKLDEEYQRMLEQICKAYQARWHL